MRIIYNGHELIQSDDYHKIVRLEDSRLMVMVANDKKLGIEESMDTIKTWIYFFKPPKGEANAK